MAMSTSSATPASKPVMKILTSAPTGFASVFTVEDYHLQWNRTTVSADVYRTRQNYQPTLSFALTPNLFITSGLSFERMNEALPTERD